MSSFKPVEAVARALKILRVVNEEKHSTLTSIHKRTGIDKSTIVRMLETLNHEGYVARDPERPIYSPTARTMLLSQGYDKAKWVASIAEPTLVRFRNAIGWPSDIALFDYDAMVVAQTSRESGPLSFNRRPGFRSPILVTSIGLAYLAFCADEERQRIIDRLAASPEEWNKLARERERLDGILEQVRRDGYATMSGDYSNTIYSGNVWAIGVPVMHEGTLFATMNIMLLKSAITLDEARTNLLVPLQSTATEIAKNLAESLR